MSFFTSSKPRRRIETCRPDLPPQARRRIRLSPPPSAAPCGKGSADDNDVKKLPPTPTPPPPPLSSRVRVVLVSPRTSANVGAACRASSNFGVEELVVVAPRSDPWDDDARKLSRGVSPYQKLRVVSNLEEALEGTTAAVGVSRRTGGARKAYEGVGVLLGARITGVSFASRRRREKKNENERILPLALVFGREESGLTAAELARCSACLALRTSHDAPSLNLSAAVAVTLALLQEEAARVDDDEEENEEQRGERRERSSSGSSSSSSTASMATTVTSSLPPPVLPAEIAPPSAIDALVLRVAELACSLDLEEEARETAGGGGAHGRKLRMAGHARALLTRARASRSEVGAMHALLRAAEQRLEGGEVVKETE